MDFIFMLTHNDATIDSAPQVLSSIIPTGLTHVGFKDVGATPARQLELTRAAHDAGMTVYLEVVSVDKADELAAVDAAVEAGVDWIVGGTHARDALVRLDGTGVKLAPFPGRVVGHPSVLEGEIAEIVEHARELSALEGVHGVDLLAYRHHGVDPLELTASVASGIDVPVIAAGSVVRQEQIAGLARAGAAGFTIGGAIFDGLLPGDKDVVSQVRTALRFAEEATAAAGGPGLD